jgi:hypothetical protein
VSQIPENNPEGWPAPAAEPGGQPQPGYYGQPGPGIYPPPQAEAAVPVLSEFDHLFRDSAPDTRRSVMQDMPSVRVAGGQAPAVQYPGQNPVPPQWPATAAGQVPEPAAGQYPAQYSQYPAQDQGQQQYQQQVPAQQQYEQQQYEPQQSQYNQTQYLPQAQTQPIKYQPQPDGYGAPAFQPGSGDGNPDGPQWSGDGGGGKSKRTPILIGGVALVVVVGLVLAFNSGGSSAPPKKQPVAVSTTTAAPTATQQAGALLALVQQSSALRSKAISAVDDLTSSGCSQLAADQTSLQSTSAARGSQAKAVAELDVAGLPGGTQLVSDLTEAWTASATSDAAYAKIAGDLSAASTTNCKGPSKQDPNYSAAVQADGDATRAKDAAATLWNSDLTAAPISLAEISASQL